MSVLPIESLFPDLHLRLAPQAAAVEAHRCLNCFDAPCTAACPTHIDVPGFIKKIAHGNLRGSALRILDANILGLSCSKACPVDLLCEGYCVLHSRGERPISIGALQRHAMEHFYNSGARVPWKAEPELPFKVACIGGGPASLACAAELRRAGIGVTIFERKPRAGGLNTHGVAEYKLRARESLGEVEFVRSLGAEFVTNCTIGEDISLADLERDFDVIFAGAGLGEGFPLELPGEGGPIRIDALAFIEAYKTSTPIPTGNRVAVIGGGNTAIDAACAAHRLGAGSVTLVYRRSESEMPAFAFEIEHARSEGVRMEFLAAPAALRPDGIECQRMRLISASQSGRRQVEPEPGATFVIPCDSVIAAVGQSRLGGLLAASNVELRDGIIVIDPETGRTSNPKYFAGGDCANGGSEVVDAVAQGKRAAIAIREMLRG
ncbi:MAG TPA: NAD(P)-dependent oxidoreductase [Bryobacteraceae bacterium]|nr:NAD(P)-dependent oxidoreductase [Bryobacteraceae bacterium]